jgi:hypothetical protein
MFTRTVVAVLIAVSALVGSECLLGSPSANAEPRGRGHRSRGDQRGRSRQWQGRREYWNPGRGWGYDNPLGSILGGIFGGWLSQQMQPKDEEFEEDGPRTDRR